MNNLGSFPRYSLEFLCPENREVIWIITNSSKVCLLLIMLPDLIILLINFSNIKMKFLPPNTPSLNQPLDQRVIADFKVCYCYNCSHHENTGAILEWLYCLWQNQDLFFGLGWHHQEQMASEKIYSRISSITSKKWEVWKSQQGCVWLREQTSLTWMCIRMTLRSY